MHTEEENNQEMKDEPTVFTLADFLESIPPNQLFKISDLSNYTHRLSIGNVDEICTPELQLHCPDEACNGTRFFRCINDSAPRLSAASHRFFYLTYKCSNCQKTEKIFSLAARIDEEKEASGECYKFGELPPFGPPTPSRLISLIGPDRDAFLKGRRCENQGLGIGAFVYYRRVIENQKNRILSEIVKVSEKVRAKPQTIETLKAAIDETQFSKALSMAKDSIPESLLINGHNPLLLLHSALSGGIHDRSDEECLKIAGSVRIVLAELSERLSQALKDEAELTKALSTLLNKKKSG